MQLNDEKLRVLLDRLPMCGVEANSAEGFAAASDTARSNVDEIEEIYACLRDHHELSFAGTMYFDTAQLHIVPYTGAISLAAYASRRGTQSALDWYRRMIGTQAAFVRHAHLISGIAVKERFNFSNGLSILPFEQAGNSQQIMAAAQLSGPNPFLNFSGSHFNTLAVKDVKHNRTDSLPDTPVAHAAAASVEDILTGCVLNDGLAPSLTANWSEFLCPDMRAAETSWATSGHPQEAAVHSGRHLIIDDISNIELFLGMKGKFKEQLRVALTRVALARRKYTTANKAIEYSIALESLLGDGNAEMTHKIATRAATILGSDLDQKVKYRKLFKKLYNVRSKAVHGQNVSQDDQSEVVRESEKAISRLLLAAAKRGEVFDFDELDLDGGP